MSGSPPGLELKTAILERPATADVASSVNPLGIVTALVAVTGVRDHVDDVITPGAFARTLRERTPHPRLLHNWYRPIGNTLGIQELPPGHPELPKRTPDNRPWPVEAGALVARYRLDLSTKDGRRALAWAQGKLGSRPWYSIGYVPVRTRRLNGARHLDDLDLWEYSQVYNPANDLAFQMDVKELPNLIDSEQQLPPEMIEVKVRYVRDATYWGYPVGTPITDAMKPQGRAAVRLRQIGRIPARTAGTTTEKPAEGARSARSRPDEGVPEGLFPEPGTQARVRASAAATGDINGAVTSLILELENERDGDVGRAIAGLLHEGETPAELEEDLRADQTWTARDAERDDLIESALADYRSAYRTRVAQQAERRAAAANWEPPSQEAFDRIAAQATAALESFEEQSLTDRLAELGHDDPEGFAGYLLGENTTLKKAGAELAAFITEQRGRTTPSGDIGERLGDLSERDDADLVSLRDSLEHELDTDDEAVLGNARALINAELDSRGAVAIGDLTPGDVFDYEDRRYWVAPDGGLIDPEGEVANLPRGAYRTRIAHRVQRDAPRPARRVDVEQLDAVGGHLLPDAPAARMSAEEYAQRGRRAAARRERAVNIIEERRQADQEAGYAAAADALADAAPARIDLDALRARRQTVDQQSDRRRSVEPAANGRLAVVGSGTKNWSVVTGANMTLVNSSMFDATAKPTGKRALADLAAQLAALRDGQGRPAPFTATIDQIGTADRPDWVRGWRDDQGRSLSEASAAVIESWAEQNGLTFRYSASSYQTPPPTAPGGAPDADGFRMREVEEIAPGDEVRLPDGATAMVVGVSDDDRIQLADGRALAASELADAPRGLGRTIQVPVRFDGDPDDAGEQRDPGMGPIPASAPPPGRPITENIEQRWPYEYDRPYPTGTRMAVLPATEPSDFRPRDNSARVGTLLARVENVAGNDFQTVRYDDGTYDQIRVGALRSSTVRPDSLTYVPNPSPEQVNAGRAAWDLPPDENATPIPAGPASPPRPAFTPTPRPEPRRFTDREQQTSDRIHEGPRAYVRWVAGASDEDLADEEQTLLGMRSRMPTGGSSAATEFTHFNQRYVQPVRRERERRSASAPVPASPAGTGAAAPANPEPAVELLPIPDPAVPDHPRPADTWRLMFARQDTQSARDEFAANGWRLRDVREQDRDRWVRRLEGLGWTVHAYPPEPVPEPSPPTVDIPQEQLDAATNLSDEVFGITELPDGSLEVTPDVADRQDRVADLLDRRESGALDLTTQDTEELTRERDDLHAELGLQMALEYRRQRTPATRQRAPKTPADQAAPQRPGLIGAAQDHAEALRSGDVDAIARTQARLESSLRRSRATSDSARQLADHITAATPNDAAAIENLAAQLKAETRQRRAAAARKRRTVRRLERERIRSLLGEVDAELRSREATVAPTAESPAAQDSRERFDRFLAQLTNPTTAARYRYLSNVQVAGKAGRIGEARDTFGDIVGQYVDESAQGNDRDLRALRGLLQLRAARGKELPRSRVIPQVADAVAPVVLRSSPDSQQRAQATIDRVHSLAGAIRSNTASDSLLSRVLLQPMRMDEIADELDQVADLLGQRLASATAGGPLSANRPPRQPVDPFAGLEEAAR